MDVDGFASPGHDFVGIFLEPGGGFTLLAPFSKPFYSKEYKDYIRVISEREGCLNEGSDGSGEGSRATNRRASRTPGTPGGS